MRYWNTPDSKVHGANMGHAWVLSVPDGPHVGPMNLAIRDGKPEDAIQLGNVLYSDSIASVSHNKLFVSYA